MLLIDETLPVKETEKTRGILGFTYHLKTVQRICRLIDTMTGARDNAEIRLNERSICRLPAKGYGATEFDMSPERQKALIDSAKEAMEAYLWQRRA